MKDREAVDAYHALAKWEGILPALETSHAIAYLIKHADTFKKKDIVIVNLSGRGDKDVEQVAQWTAEHPKRRKGSR